MVKRLQRALRYAAERLRAVAKSPVRNSLSGDGVLRINEILGFAVVFFIRLT